MISQKPSAQRPLFVATSLMLSLGSLYAADDVTLGNGKVARHLSWEGGSLKTVSLKNEVGQKEIVPKGGSEFALTVLLKDSKEPLRLTAADFKVTGNKSSEKNGTKQLDLTLTTTKAPLALTVHYEVKKGEPWMRKQIAVTAKQELEIEKVEVENLTIEDAVAPYKADQMTAQGVGQWRPPLGQPLYTQKTASWWGMEFPAARNEIKDGALVCGYLSDVPLKAGESWTSHSAAVGVADDPAYVKDAFFEYIDATRVRPLRLQTQYNSWFDYGPGVSSDSFNKSVTKVNEELCKDRGVPPLRAYVIDDGWQDAKADWSKTGVWTVNAKFANDFEKSRAAIKDAKSNLGLWLSPGCVFGGQGAIPKMKEAGWRSLQPWMSMTGEAYMSALEKRMVELAGDGVDYFKLDGVFGHLNTRNFDIEGFQGAEKELNDKKHTDAKERYLAQGSERLMKIFKRMGEANPDVYIVISNGAYLSPWWLQHIDAVWMINAGDAAGGADRTGELVYRDGVYYQLASDQKDNTQYPLNSLFNHEPKKTETGEDADVFRRYLYMNLSRGTGFVELYLKTFKLSEGDWDVLAEGMKWVHKVFPNFKYARMVGGDPKKNEVYGYTGWTDQSGYLSLHNPSAEPKEFRITLNRAAGLPKTQASSSTTYTISSPLQGDTEGLAKSIKAGSELVITLPPKAIRVLEFNAAK